MPHGYAFSGLYKKLMDNASLKKLPEVVKSYENFPSKSRENLPIIVKKLLWLPKDTKSYQKLPKVTKSYQKLPKVTKSYQKLP